jgi:tetratricopeptide (TPR) repeat protein
VGGEAHCFKCGSHVEFHVTADNIEPFWRRLEKAFKYPLNSNALMMVVGLSVFSAIVSAMPFQGLFTLLLHILIAGATVNYSFLCLTASSEGDMIAPKLSDAFAGSFSVLWKLFLMSLVVGFGLYGLAINVSPIVAGLALIVVFIGLPAILMCFAHTGSVLESLNPLNFVRLMTTIGAPYIVLILFLFIMMSSVGVLNDLIGKELAALSAILQSSVSNYYAIVSFHLMGYLLYQYQDRLGFSTADNEEAMMHKAEVADVALSHANLRLKEGEYDRVNEILKQALDVTRQDKKLNARYFDVLYRTENKTELATFGDRYFNHLIETAQTDRLVTDFKRIKQLLPTYSPKIPHVRYHLASACRAKGDAMSAVQLINGMHKLFPDYEKLVASYQLMKLALDDLPNMEKQAEKCHAMVTQLQKKFPKQENRSEEATMASFDVAEPEPVVAPSSNEVDKISSPAENQEKDLSPIEFKL